MSREDIWAVTGVGLYQYDVLCDFTDKEVRAYCQSMRQKAASLAKSWSQDLSTEWISRSFLAVKMILAAQLLLNAAYYAARKNLFVTQPYLIYYALLNSCRAVLFTDLHTDWRQGSLRTISHDKIRTMTVSSLRRLSRTKAEEIDSFILRAKKHRELLSYSFPATGLREIRKDVDMDKAADVAALLCEIAEANSECLESAWRKHSNVHFDVAWESLVDICLYDGEPAFTDDNDLHHASFLKRKVVGPACLCMIMTFGAIDDFQIAWCANSDFNSENDDFDPDHFEAPPIFHPLW